MMRADRYEKIDPDRWWRRGPERYVVILEYFKDVYSVVAPYVDEPVV
jgi:hypothetical protein